MPVLVNSNPQHQAMEFEMRTDLKLPSNLIVPAAFVTFPFAWSSFTHGAGFIELGGSGGPTTLALGVVPMDSLMRQLGTGNPDASRVNLLTCAIAAAASPYGFIFFNWDRLGNGGWYQADSTGAKVAGGPLSSDGSAALGPFAGLQFYFENTGAFNLNLINFNLTLSA